MFISTGRDPPEGGFECVPKGDGGKKGEEESLADYQSAKTSLISQIADNQRSANLSRFLSAAKTADYQELRRSGGIPGIEMRRLTVLSSVCF